MYFNVGTLEAVRDSFYRLGKYVFITSHFGIKCNRCGKTKYIEGKYLLKSLNDGSYKCCDCVSREKRERMRCRQHHEKYVENTKTVKCVEEQTPRSNTQYKMNMGYTGKIVVTMTSWSKRIKNCHDVVNSVLKQTVPPDIIYLNLSSEEFKNKENDLPKNLIELRDANENFVINWVDGENTKSMKKVFPILKFLDDDDVIIDTDDDIIMPRDLIEKRLNDFSRTGKRTPITSCKIKFDLAGAPCYIMSAWSVFKPKMLSGWENIVSKEIIKTYNDDRTYLLMMWLNGYKCAPCTSYDVFELVKRFTKNANDGMTKNKIHLIGRNYDRVVEPVIVRLFGKKIRDCFGILKTKNENQNTRKEEQKIDFIIPYTLSAKKAKSVAMTKFNRLEIEYVLRSIRKFCPFAGRIFLATNSELPERISSQVKVIKVGDPYTHIKDANIINKIKTVIERVPDLSDVFIMASDDQIVRKISSLDDFNPRLSIINPKCSKDLAEKLRTYEKRSKDNWYKALLLTMQKFPKRQYVYQPHIWSPMNKHKFIEMCNKYDISKDRGVITQSLYYNFIGQPKISNYDHTYLSRDCTSIGIGKAIKGGTRHLAWTDTAFKNKKFRDYLDKILF